MALPNQQDLKFDGIGPSIDAVILNSQWPRNINEERNIIRAWAMRSAAIDSRGVSPLSASDADNFISASSRMLFGDSFRYFVPRVQIGYVWDIHEQKKGVAVWDGTSTQIIWINLAFCEDAVVILSTIWHEMCHVLINALYHYELDAGRKISGRLIGKSGHGYHWQRLAKAVEERARQVYDFRIDLHRHVGVWVDVRTSGKLPPDAYYQILFEGTLKTGHPRWWCVKRFVEGLYAEYGHVPDANTFPFEDEEAEAKIPPTRLKPKKKFVSPTMTSTNGTLHTSRRPGSKPAVEAQIVKDRVSGRSKGVGYVEFRSGEYVQMAIAITGQKLESIPVIVQLTEAEKNSEGGVTQSNGVPFHRLLRRQHPLLDHRG
ncbi:hypothetical protein PRZ48_005265 [Zasmidium cellare]|uniref:RRM domain-containing protein n=1 Tax=Zasmidium cellare TaxID=395010 RepID=A0ABR0ERV5_ZASCE|nr:hypothetical protein PRZ48_005265 [Zasmidium cellare]